MEQINYTVGDEIYALGDHKEGLYKVGEMFIAKGLLMARCGCKCLCVDIGHIDPKSLNKAEDEYMICAECEEEDGLPEPTQWYYASNFSKALTTSEEQDMEESIKEVMERELVEQ